VTQPPFESRVAIASEYVRELAECDWRDWDQRYAAFVTQKSSTAEAMLLVHPGWMPPTVDAVKMRHGPSFGAARADREPCQSAVLWGYECPFEGDVVHADHYFPYWAGGVTHSTNRLVLCDRHNRWKCGDIHLWAWEQPLPDWARIQIERVRDARSSALLN
jgi:hypothetical protein